MARMFFAARLRGVAPADGTRVSGGTVRAGLEAAFALAPLLRSYVLNERGDVRPEIALFIDQRPVANLEAVLGPAADLHVLSSR